MRIPALLALLLGSASAFADCLQYGQQGVAFTGPVLTVESRRTGKPVVYWVVRLPAPVCVDGGKVKADVPEADVGEVLLSFAEGSPYYGIYKGVVNGQSAFRVSGALHHARGANPVRKVVMRVDDFVPRSGR